MPDRAVRFAALGEVLRAARHARAWTQAELAALLGVHQSAIVKLEQGTRRPEPSTLHALATALLLSYDRLAVLAGYQLPDGGEVEITVPRVVAGELRELATLPPPMLRFLLRHAREVCALQNMPKNMPQAPASRKLSG